jgi:MarR family transcriptional regulator, organic hydroperoxide resistance regulator
MPKVSNKDYISTRAKPAVEKPVVTSDRNENSRIVLDHILPYVANRFIFEMNQLLKKDLRKQHGLTIANWRILAVLQSSQKVSVNELAAYAMIEQSTLSRLITRMEADGLIRRQHDDIDGRARSISLTPLGRQKYKMVRALAYSHELRATHGLSEQEKSEFQRIVSVMRANLEQAL